MKKSLKIIFMILPIVVMIGLIPLVRSDVALALVYLAFSCVALCRKGTKNDLLFFLFGTIGLFFSEWFFISTGVEVFMRHSLLGLMPLWLPLLWGYAFIVMGRALTVLSDWK